MLFRLKLSLEKQILLFVFLILLSFLLNWYFAFVPLLRINERTLAAGILAGLLCAAAAAALPAILAYFKPAVCAESFGETRSALSRLSALAVFGAAVTAGCGEELLLRGCIFALLLRKFFIVAFLLNFVLSLALYFRGRRHFIWSTVKALECTFYALLYYYERSLFLIGVSHFTAEAVSALSPRLIAAIRQKSSPRARGIHR